MHGMYRNACFLLNKLQNLYPTKNYPKKFAFIQKICRKTCLFLEQCAPSNLCPFNFIVFPITLVECEFTSQR